MHIFIFCVGFCVAILLRRACEGLRVWDDSRIDSHAFVFYNSSHRESGRLAHITHMLSGILFRTFSLYQRRLSLPLAAIIMMLCNLPVRSQDVALKSNILYDATLSPNIGVEVGISPRWTFDLSGNLNLWTVGDGHKWRHWMLQPEARYWFCQRFAGHFLGFHALGGQYNFGNLDMGFKFLGTDFRNLKDRRYEGWGIGTGVAYGYAWPLSKHWNLEAEFGFGWVWTRFDSYPCAECGSKIDDGRVHNYVGPTKIAVNIEYVF